jgi:pimeloyl-ACP methyl ester carboxylesterase
VRRIALALLLGAAVWTAAPADPAAPVQTLSFEYTAHDGTQRTARVVLPAWYGPERHPPVPLVISPHGRGVDGAYNLRFWGATPAQGPFVLVSPDGQGRRLPLYSWGYAGQIDDLARMPGLVRDAFPWLEIDRVYAIGSSMGAQESLLLMARRDVDLAGVAALDPVSDMAARYRVWPLTRNEGHLPALARTEIGGTPRAARQAYAARSPGAYVRAIATSGVPLQIWWSHRDSVVTDQLHQTRSFYRRLLAIAPRAPAHEVVGYWEHAHEFHPQTQLRAVLACFGLVRAKGVRVPPYVVHAGTTEERPPERARGRKVTFTRAFCGRAG